MKNSLLDTYIVAHWAGRVLVWNELHYKRSIHVNKDQIHFLGMKTMMMRIYTIYC